MDCQKVDMCFYIDMLSQCFLCLLLPDVSMYQICGDLAVEGVTTSV